MNDSYAIRDDPEAFGDYKRVQSGSTTCWNGPQEASPHPELHQYSRIPDQLLQDLTKPLLNGWPPLTTG